MQFENSINYINGSHLLCIWMSSFFIRGNPGSKVGTVVFEFKFKATMSAWGHNLQELIIRINKEKKGEPKREYDEESIGKNHAGGDSKPGDPNFFQRVSERRPANQFP